MSGETVIPFDDRVTVSTPSVLTSVFDLDFPLFDDDDLTVYADGVSVPFTVTATYTKGVSTDATVSLTTAVTGVEVAIVGTRSPRRDEEFVAGSANLVKTMNADLARLAAEDQEIYRGVLRSLRFPDYETTFSAILPKAATRASKYLSFDSSGNPAVTGTAPSVQYQGAFATVDAPTTRLDGSALQVGDLYFDTTANRLKVWDGASWVTAVDASTTIDINGMAAISALAIGDFIPAYDIDAGGNRKATVQQLWNSTAILTALAAAPATGDQIPLYDISGTSAKTITIQNLYDAINNLTALTAPALADLIPLYDASAPGARSITPDNLLKVINLLTEDAAPDKSADYVAAWDASASAVKKIKLNKLAIDAWVNFDGNPVSINGSLGVSSVTDLGVGDYRVNFSTSFSDTNYAAVSTAEESANPDCNAIVKSRATGSCTINAYDDGLNALTDPDQMHAIFAR